MSLQQLYRDLENCVKDRTLTLKKDAKVRAEVLRVLGGLPEPQLVIHQADLVLDKKSLPPVLSVSGSTVGNWPILGVADSSLRPNSVSFTVTDSGSEAFKVDAKLDGTVAVGKSELPVKGSLTEQDTWAIRLADDKQRISFADLITWAGGSNALASLTSQCVGLPVTNPTAIEIFSLELGFGSESQSFLSCELAVVGQLKILQGLPAVELRSAGMSVTHYPSSTGTLQSVFAFGLRTNARIGGGNCVVAFRNLGGIGDAVAKIIPDNGQGFPALHDLAALVGAADLSSSFQQTIKSLGLDGFAIAGVDISFDAKSGVPSFVSVSGEVQFAGVTVDVFFGVPQFRLSGQLAAGQLNVVSLIKHFWAGMPSLPSLRVSEFAISFDIGTKSLTLYAEVADTWQIDLGATELTIGNIALNLDHSGAAKQPTTTARVTGITKVQGVEVDISTDLSDVVTLCGVIPRMNLTAIVKEFLNGISIPAELPDFELFDIKLSATPATGAFFISGRSSGEWGFSTGGGGMNITDVGFSLGRANAKVGIDCSIQITGKGPGQLAQGLSFGDFELRFDLIDGDKWHVEGHLAAKLYAFEMRLAADFSGGGKSRTMNFSWSEKPAPTLLSIDNMASLSLSSFTVSIMHSAGDTGQSSSGFGITGTGKITIGRSLFVSDFDIKLSTEAENDKLLFIFEQPSPIEVSLGPVAGHEPVFELELSGIHIEADGNQKTWSLTTDAHGRLHDIPELVQDYFPKDLPDGRFCVNDKGVSFDCTLATPLRPQCRMFSVKVEGREVLPKISIAKIGARLGEAPAIRGTLHVELPEALNYFLGGNPKTGKPNFVFLNPSFDLDLSIGKALSLSLANGTSPFKAFNYKTDDKGTYLDWDFGEFGVFRVDIPTLSYEGNAWLGMAGVELPSPLKVPLTPVKYILGLLAFPENLLRYIPASVPVQAIDFTDLQGSLENLLGKNTVEQIRKDKLLAEPLEEFETISGQIKKIIHRLPADFEGYLKIPDIKELRLKLGASPGGGPIIGLHTDDEHPLKVMLPWFAGMPPGFMGVTLHSLDVGQTVGGATLVKVDGVIDQFDLISLVVAGTGIIPQAQARRLKNEITFGDATFILWPALPVPIPLTYDTLKWDYQAWTGFKLFADWHLREQSNLFAIIASLIPFFSDPNAKLHEPPNKQDFELDLTIGPNYLALPDYLGGTVLGLEDTLPTMDLAYGIKCFLDAMKFGNAGYLIQAVPLQHPKSGQFIRIGSQKGAAGFGPLKFEAALGWCITTEDEFRSKIVPNKDAQKLLGQLDADAILDNLPAKSGPAFDKGFIVILMARGGLAGILEYGTNFGIAVTSTGGFETKLMMQGSIADLLSLSLYGLIKVSQKGVTTVEGGCCLKFDKTELIGSKHTITVTNHSFELIAELRLLDVVTLVGDFYIGRDQVYLKGVFSWGYAKGQAPMGALSILARFDNTGFEIGVGAANLFGTKCAQLALYLDVNKQAPIGARAKLDDLTGLNEKLGLSIKSYKGEIDKSAAASQELMNQAIADLQNNIGGFEGLRKRLPGYLNTLRTKTIPDTINSRVQGAYKDLKWWQKKVVKESTIRNETKAYYRKYFAGRIQTLEDGLKNIKGGDEAAKNSQTRKLLQQTLQSVIDIGDIKYTYKKTVGKTFSKTVTIPDPVKPYRKQLQDLKTVIGQLPDSWDKAHAAEATYAAKDKIRQGISEVVKNIDKQTPKIESVQLDLPLVFTAPVADAYVTMHYAGKSRLLKPVHLDLGNPVKSIDSITEAFANLLSADAE